MKKKIFKKRALIGLSVLCLAFSMAGCSGEASEDDKDKESQVEQTKAPDKDNDTEEGEGETKVEESDALVPIIMDKNKVEQNPYLPDAEAMIHNDVYNSDVTNKAVPLGIYTEVSEGISKVSPYSPPAFFYDDKGNAVCPYSLITDAGVISGGMAIRDMDDDELAILGEFMPALDDGLKYGIQSSYSFVDAKSNLVGPTTNGHVIMLKMYDEEGNILKKFEKVLYVDVMTPATKALGEDIDTNLLSIIYDYEGNLWFVTGGFHINPEHNKDGVIGYLEREYIDKCLAGEKDLDASGYLHYIRMEDGEGAENGIGSHKEGCVVLTNKECYMLSADNGVNVKWSVPYETVGGKGAVEGETVTGAGLAWGGGSSPTMTNDLVLFTDNLDVINLYAVNAKTGKVECKTPVLDLGEDVIVSVENSIAVYSSSPDVTTVLLCNWYGAGNAGLFKPGANSSIQTYDNIYDSNWREGGSKYLMPGVERVDIVKQEDGSYKAKTIWTRDDLKDTSMMKLSTATGYFYGYTQFEDTGEWGFFSLDKDTGETDLFIPVSKDAKYNNIAVGIMQGNNGNTMYCPTNSEILVRIQDRFAYLPEKADQKLNLNLMKRNALSDEEFKTLSGLDKKVVGYELEATYNGSQELVAFRVNGLNCTPKDLEGYIMNSEGKYEALSLVITNEKGEEIKEDEALNEKVIYEIRVTGKDGDKFDLNSDEGDITTKVVLAKNE